MAEEERKLLIAFAMGVKIDEITIAETVGKDGVDLFLKRLDSNPFGLKNVTYEEASSVLKVVMAAIRRVKIRPHMDKHFRSGLA